MSFDLSAEELQKYLPSFAANYAKRFLEKVYDGVFKTQLGQWLTGLSSGKKYGLEAILYGLTSFFESRLAENTKLRKFVKEVGIDTAPEISKRMINGAKEEIVLSAKTAEEKELAQLLLELEDDDFLGLISWLYEKKAMEIREIAAQLSRLSPEQISKLMGFSQEDREKFFHVLNPEPWPERASQEIIKMMLDDVRKVRQGFCK